MNRIILNAEKYSLKTLLTEDATVNYQRWLNDKDITKTLETDSRLYSIEELTEVILSHDNKTKFIFGVFTADNYHVGNFRVTYKLRNKVANIGLLIGDKNFWGTPIVNICRKALINWIFFSNDINKIECRPMSINYAALFNFHSQGWKQEGVLREHYFKNNKFIDAVCYGLTKNDWINLNNKQKDNEASPIVKTDLVEE